MNKNVLVISTSMRPKSNSHHLALQFAEGAKQAGHNVELVSLRGKKISFCTGCLTCHRTGHCVIADDANTLIEKIRQAEVVAFASPVYFYCLSGQLRTLMDRCNPLYTAEDCAMRDLYLLSSAGDEGDAETILAGSVKALQGFADCFPETRLAGTVLASGLVEANTLSADSEPAEQAFRLGKNV